MDRNRAKFGKGQQKLFLMNVMDKLKCKYIKDLLKLNLEISYSALKKYFSENGLMEVSFVKKLCMLSGIDINSLSFNQLPFNWGASKGGKIGIVKMMEEYKSKLPLWRKKARKKTIIRNTKRVKLPQLNEKLAEFIGAYLGDGTLTPYVVRISGDYRYDKPYFDYLSEIVWDLFGIYPSIYKEKHRNTLYFLLCSKKICHFLNQEYNLKCGDKIRNNSCIPPQIFKNDKFLVACLRGLIDTDGSVSRRGRNGSQFCIHFCSYNPKLLNQVAEIGKRFKLFTYSYKYFVGTNRWENIKKYFHFVGSSNLKHIIRFDLKNTKNEAIYLKDVQDYLKKDLYININLPFKMASWSNG